MKGKLEKENVNSEETEKQNDNEEFIIQKVDDIIEMETPISERKFYTKEGKLLISKRKHHKSETEELEEGNESKKNFFEKFLECLKPCTEIFNTFNTMNESSIELHNQQYLNNQNHRDFQGF